MKEQEPFRKSSELSSWLASQNEITEYAMIYSSYKAAIREVSTKLKNLDEDFELLHKRDPIHSIQSRVKSPKSVFAKMDRKGLPVSATAIRDNIFDIAGIRVICHYIDDIYTVAELLAAQDDIEIIEQKDYIKNPKPNGYRSLHLVLKVPVFFVERKEFLPVEIQIRTIAMDFWASLEHQLRYKSEEEIPNFLVDELRECAQTITETDLKMKKIHDFLESLENI